MDMTKESLKHDHWERNETRRGSVIRESNRQPEAWRWSPLSSLILLLKWKWARCWILPSAATKLPLRPQTDWMSPHSRAATFFPKIILFWGDCRRKGWVVEKWTAPWPFHDSTSVNSDFFSGFAHIIFSSPFLFVLQHWVRTFIRNYYAQFTVTCKTPTHSLTLISVFRLTEQHSALFTHTDEVSPVDTKVKQQSGSVPKSVSGKIP